MNATQLDQLTKLAADYAEAKADIVEQRLRAEAAEAKLDELRDENARLRGTNAALGSRVIMHELKVACARVEELERQLSNEVATWNRFRMLINEVRACYREQHGGITHIPDDLWERLKL